MGTTVSPEVSPVETAVDHVLEDLDPHLDGIRTLIGKTDIDFIDDGNYSEALKAANNEAISEAINEFNGAAAAKSFEEAVGEGELSPENLIALRHVFGHDLTLRRWNHRAIGSSYEESLPELVDTVQDLRPKFLDTVEKVDEIVEWWRNGSPYFIVEGSIDRDRSVYGATVYPSSSEANVKTVRDRIVASFRNGVEVAVIERLDGRPIWISVGKGDKAFKIPLLGFHGYNATIDDFMGGSYEKYTFLGEDSPALKTDVGHFATRVALELMTPSNTEVEVSLPSEEYREKIVDLLAGNVVGAFSRAKLYAEVRDSISMMSGYRVDGVDVHREKNLVSTSTESEIKAFLHGVGASIVDLSTATDSKLQVSRSSDNLGNRIDAIKTQSDVDEFFSTIR